MAVISGDTGLAKVVVAAPKRQLEVALPEQLPVSALLPTLLRQGGDELVTEGLATSGWVLRRADGTALEGPRTLAAQGVRDGEVLHLLPRRTEWPQVQYDHIVDAIAAGARRGGPAWSPSATRITGLLSAALVLIVIPATVLVAGGPWLIPGVALLILAMMLAGTGAALSRALADSVAGGVVATLALPYAMVGGMLLVGGDLPVAGFGAPQLLMGCSALLVAAVVGYVVVSDLRWVFVAGIVTALFGILGSALTLILTTAVGGAAALVTVFLILAPALPLLSVRLAKVPMPAVPRDRQDLVDSDVLPPLRQVLDQVGWSLELLVGALTGGAVATVAGVGLLAASGTSSGLLLAAVVSVAHLLRARMLVAVRQRTPLLAAGLGGVLLTTAGLVAVAPDWVRVGLVLPGLLLVAGGAVASALVFSRRPASPYLGRLADILDVLLTLSAGPLAAGVLGLYPLMRGLSG